MDTTALDADTVVIKVPTLTRAWETDTIFRTPESVVFDQTNNVLYVSNIGGVPANKRALYALILLLVGRTEFMRTETHFFLQVSNPARYIP